MNYDNLLTKLALILGVSKDYFVKINFLYGAGLKDLEEKYKIAQRKYHLPYDFFDLLYILDYICSVDLMAYVDNLEKETILSGGETHYVYEIHPKRNAKLSFANERALINNFDVNNFWALLKYNGPYQEFAAYIIDDEKKELIDKFLESNEKKR